MWGAEPKIACLARQKNKLFEIGPEARLNRMLLNLARELPRVLAF